MSRELTREERAAIRSLVLKWCANYDREYGCLPLDCECYMLRKYWTGAYCRYFREAVLHLDPRLEAALAADGAASDFKSCPVCGVAFVPNRRQLYCSPACQAEGNRQKSRARMRSKRAKPGGRRYD